MSAIHFSNFVLEDETEYFLYIGELKNYGLNHFLKESLTRIYNRKFDFIAIVPDVFEQYNYDNIIVINPLVKTYACKYGSNVNCRVSSREFMTAASESGQIRALIRRLLNRQKTVYVYIFESMPEMTLDDIPGVEILGPDKHVARRLNSKIYQYRNLDSEIPVVEFKICSGLDDLMRTTDGLWSSWTDGIFVSKEYSAAGVNALIAHHAKDILEKFQGADDPYLTSRYIPHEYDPTVLAVVAGEDDVYIAGVADQCIEGGTRFTGSTFPTVLPADVVDKLKDYTVRAGNWIAREGYRGIFGCDYLVTAEGDIRFLEINARKQGTTLEFCCTLEQCLPAGSPMLPELEFYAVTEGVLPAGAVEMNQNLKSLHWGTYNYKISDPVLTESYIPHSIQERDGFKRVADGKLKKDFLILEHTGSDFIVAQGAFIARIVALGHDHQSVRQGIRQGRRTIDLTIACESSSLSEKKYG